MDSANAAYLTGSTISTDFPVTVSAAHPLIAGGSDSFVAKFGAANASAVAILSSTAGTSAVGQAVTFTVTVTGTTPGGKVACFDGSTAIVTNVTLTNGVATCATSSLAAGAHTIKATYNGDANNAGGSATVTQTVGAASPASGGASGGGCTANLAGTPDWVLLSMFAVAGLSRLRRSRQRT